MVQVLTTSIVLSVVILVVLETSRIGRESNLVQFETPGSWYGLPLPHFNRLFAVHLINMLIMTAAFDLLYDTDGIKNVLTIGLLALIVWLILPLLEIEAYGKYDSNNATQFPHSWGVHVAYTVPVPFLQATRESLLWISRNYEYPVSFVNAILSLNPLLSVPTLLLVYLSSIKFFRAYSEEIDIIAHQQPGSQFDR